MSSTSSETEINGNGLSDGVIGYCNEHKLINVTEIAQLTNMGLRSAGVTWSKVRMSSDQWICMLHDNGSPPSSPAKMLPTLNPVIVTLLDPHNGMSESFSTSRIQSAQMNPSKPIIAMSTEDRVFVMCLQTNKCIRSTVVTYKVEYWTWINDYIIGIVSLASVYHWDLSVKSSEPKFVFARDERLSFRQVVDYQTDPSMSWSALSTLGIEDGVVDGLVQVYSKPYELHNCISAHCVQFAKYTFNDNVWPSNLILAANRTGKMAKVYVMELGPSRNGTSLVSRADSVRWSECDDDAPLDYPASVKCSNKLGLVFVLSKYGSLYILDLECGTELLHKIPVSHDLIFLSTLDTHYDGLICLTRNGSVLSIELQLKPLIDHLEEMSKKSIVDRLRKILELQDTGDEVTRL